LNKAETLKRNAMKHIKLFYAILLITGIFLAGCEEDSSGRSLNFPLEQPDSIDNEEYGVYSFILDETFSSEKIVIAQESVPHIRVTYDSDYFDYFRNNFPDFDTTLVANLNEVNDTTYLFEDEFHSDDNQLIVVSSEELSYIFDSQNVNNNWQEFYRRYENAVGYIKFSRIGFNDDQTQAILEAGHLYGSVGGEGSIIYLVKQRGKWVIKDRRMTWIA